MGTNYYVYKNIPEEHKLILDIYGCKIEPLHLGKVSAGWEFVWQAHDELGLTSIDSWLKYLCENSVIIKTEYGEHVTLEEFLRKVYDLRKYRSIKNMEEHCVYEQHSLDRYNNLFIYSDFF